MQKRQELAKQMRQRLPLNAMVQNGELKLQNLLKQTEIDIKGDFTSVKKSVLECMKVIKQYLEDLEKLTDVQKQLISLRRRRNSKAAKDLVKAENELIERVKAHGKKLPDKRLIQLHQQQQSLKAFEDSLQEVRQLCPNPDLFFQSVMNALGPMDDRKMKLLTESKLLTDLMEKLDAASEQLKEETVSSRSLIR